MIVLNLDQKAAEYAQEMVNLATQTSNVKKPIEILERLVTKTLGVLQEQGVYACILFLYSRSSDEAKIAPAIRSPLFHVLQDKKKNHKIPIFEGKPVPANDAASQTALAFYSSYVCQELDTLLLVKELYEQTLIYARYGAKAAGNEVKP